MVVFYTWVKDKAPKPYYQCYPPNDLIIYTVSHSGIDLLLMLHLVSLCFVSVHGLQFWMRLGIPRGEESAVTDHLGCVWCNWWSLALCGNVLPLGSWCYITINYNYLVHHLHEIDNSLNDKLRISDENCESDETNEYLSCLFNHLSPTMIPEFHTFYMQLEYIFI